MGVEEDGDLIASLASLVRAIRVSSRWSARCTRRDGCTALCTTIAHTRARCAGAHLASRCHANVNESILRTGRTLKVIP